MIRIYYRHVSGTLVKDFPKEQLAAAIREGNANVWVDLHDPTHEEYTEILEEVFRFHPLAIEDTTTSLLVPKLNDYRRYLFLVIHSIHYGESPVDLISNEMDIFLGPNFLVTVHDGEFNAIEHLWADPELHETEGLSRGPAMLLYELLELQVDRFTRLLDQFEMELEELGDRIFLQNQFSNELLERILTAKSSALRLGRVLRPQRDLMHKLSTSEYSAIPGNVRIYFADIYDHLVRMVGLVEGMQELVRSTVDIHMALANTRMNEIMKVLTIISTIFIPLSFMAGVYGMNFEVMPELGWRWAYPLLWVVFLSVAGLLLRFFRRSGWL